MAWIKVDHSEGCPVPKDQMVIVKFRNGTVGKPNAAGMYDWGDSHDGEYTIDSYLCLYITQEEYHA